MGSNPSIDSITDRVKDRQYKLIVDRTIAGANSSTMLQKTWLVEDRTGEFSLIVTQNNDANARRVMCGVTLPKETELGVERALTEPSQFGPPDSQSWRRYFGHGYKWILSRA